MNKIGLALMAATLMMASCKQETKQDNQTQDEPKNDFQPVTDNDLPF